jgi:hypothetical protein
LIFKHLPTQQQAKPASEALPKSAKRMSSFFQKNLVCNLRQLSPSPKTDFTPAKL